MFDVLDHIQGQIQHHTNAEGRINYPEIPMTYHQHIGRSKKPHCIVNVVGHFGISPVNYSEEIVITFYIKVLKIFVS